MLKKTYLYFLRKMKKIQVKKFLFDLKIQGALIGQNVKIYGNVNIINPSNLVIGDNVTINEDVVINCRDKVVIGNNCHLSSGCKIHTGYLNPDDMMRKHLSQPINIGTNVWIASGAIIGAGVSIGNNSIVGANSVLLENIDSNIFCAGIPAKKIKILQNKDY